MTMGYEANHITERIIKITLRILYLLFQEDYVIIKKSGDQLGVGRDILGFDGGSKSPKMKSSSQSNTPENNNFNRILTFTNKIIELLMAEVPIRLQDASVYLSMEEWDFLNRHKYLYSDIMAEVHQPLTSTDTGHTESTFQLPMSLQYDLDEDYDIVITTTNNYSADEQMENFANLSFLYQGQNFSHFEKLITPYSMHGALENMRTIASCMDKTCSALVDHTYAISSLKARAILKKQGYQQEPNSYSSSGGTQYSEGNKMEESHLHKAEQLPNSDGSSYVDYRAVRIKEDPYICNEEVSQACSFTSGKHYNDTSPLIKEEAIPYQDLLQNSSTYAPSANVQPVRIKEEPISGEEEVPAEIELYVDGTLCPSNHSKKPKKTKLVRHEDRPFSCNECGKRFKQKSGLGMHKKMHAKGKRNICHICGKCFLSLAELNTHERSHTEEKPYSCGECGKHFRKATKLANHQKIHATDNPFSCAKCGKQFSCKSNLCRHQKKKKHKTEVDTTEFAHMERHKGFPSKQGLYPCAECGRRFIKKINLIKHQRLHTKKNLHYCQECDKYLMSRAYLLRHMERHSKKRRSFSCSLCGKYFGNKLDLTIHQRIHKGDKSGMASEWRKSFIRKLGFVIQERSNVGEMPYTCPDCGDRFERKLQLLRHQKTHDKKPDIESLDKGTKLSDSTDGNNLITVKIENL